MRNLKIPIKLLFITMVLSILSCNSTKVISSWSIDDIPPGTMNKVLVVGVMPNREQRDKTEQAMVNELNKYNVSAFTSLGVFGPNGFRGLTEDEIVQKLTDSNYSSVMIISLQDKEKQKTYVPGNYYGSRWSYNRFYRRYWTVYDQMYTPGYYTTTTNYVLQAEIYNLNGDELVYSTQTRSYDPSSASSLAEGFAKSIVNELESKAIIRR